MHIRYVLLTSQFGSHDCRKLSVGLQMCVCVCVCVGGGGGGGIIDEATDTSVACKSITALQYEI